MKIIRLATDADNSLISIDDGSNSPAASISTISKRQKHKNRKKMQKLLKKVTQESDAVKEEVDGGAPKLRLDASYFRYLNEQLYTISSNEAAKIFSEDPSAFEAYHKGYQQQVFNHIYFLSLILYYFR
jgi:hypothetical protein